MKKINITKIEESNTTSQLLLKSQEIEMILLNENNSDLLNEIINLRERESTRYVITRDEIELLFNSKFAMDRPVDWWIIKSGNNYIGYGIVNVNIRANNTEPKAALSSNDTSIRTKPSKITLIEFNGFYNSFLLEYSIDFWLKYYSCSVLKISKPKSSSPSSLSNNDNYKIFSNSLIYKVEYLNTKCHGTILVLNGGRLFEKCTNLFSERITSEEFKMLNVTSVSKQKIILSVDDEFIELKHGGAIAKLFFEGINAFTLPSQTTTKTTSFVYQMKIEGKLYSILSKLFPIPLSYGALDFI